MVHDGKLLGSRCPLEEFYMMRAISRKDQFFRGKKDEYKDEMVVAGNVLDEEQSLFLAGNMFPTVDDDWYDSTGDDMALNVGTLFFESYGIDAFGLFVDEGTHLSRRAPGPFRPWRMIVSHSKSMWKGQAKNIVGVQSRLTNKPDMVMNDSVTFELARYKELVEEYEKRAKFELTDREQKIDEQMRIIISDRNRKETSLKSELHSAQILLSSTVDHYKSKTKEVTLLKKDFKQKEDKFLEEFLDIKKLKDKIEDRLYKQDQSVQTVYMLCKPKSFYAKKNKVAIGYKNPLCLTRAKQVQPALYNGHVLGMTNHARPLMHDSEDTREIAEIIRKRLMLKMQSPLYVENKVRIASPDYSKENLLATFTPQRNLTPEQIFWSIDDNDRKKAETSVPKPLSALTVYPPNTPVKLVPR
ncbi:hypothetical protein Tco_0954775, partial [Tanacetum coccineum]